MYVLTDRRSSTKRFFRRLLSAWSLLFFILAVWEFLRWSAKSAENADASANSRRWASANRSGCFHKYSQSGTLRLNTIMSRSVAANELDGKGVVFLLNVDIIVRHAGSESLTVYPAGTTVYVGDTDEQVWEMEYFEYNDDEIGNNIINNYFVNKKHNQGGIHGHVEANESVQREYHLNQAVKSNTIKAGYISNETNTTQKTVNPNPTKNHVIDVMLLEDEMLKVRPQDQLEQQEIMQVMRHRGADRLLLRERTRLRGIPQTGTPHSLFEKDINIFKNQQNNTDVRFNEKRQEQIRQNLTKDVPLAWPDVLLDEASEPLYTDGFLERVQRAKSQLYAQSRLYDHRLKGKVKKYYILNNPQACLGGNKVDIVYLIYSQLHSKEHRQLIRDTIVKSSIFRLFNIVHVFLLGKTRVSHIQEDLGHESKLYGDIVQGDFDDKFETNAWKGLMGMRWVLQYCRNVNFILKINEGVFVDTDKLLRGLISASRNIIGKRAMFCSLRLREHNATNNLNFTKPYCDGFAVLMTRHLVCSIVAASHQIRVPSVENYYLYGVLPFVIGGVEVYNVSGNLGFQKDEVQAFNCVKEQPDGCPVVATQALPGRFTYLWNVIGSRHWKPEEWSGLWDLQSVKSYFS